MKTENRQCQNCEATFEIAPEDLAFYERIKVPSPTWCPQCRLIRRLCTSNLKNLYQDTCDLCGKKMLSMFSPEKPFTVYCNDCWWSDKWDASSYGLDYNFEEPFFKQFQQLILRVPQMALSVNTPSMVNSDYCNGAGFLKNCYWLFFADYCEDSFYSDYVLHLKDSFECLRTYDSELCFQCVNVTNSYQAAYSVDCENCHDVTFCIDCAGCENCFGCAGLRKKKFSIFNVQYTEAEYMAKVKEFNLGSFVELQKMREKVREVWLSVPRKYMHGRNNQDVTGDYIFNSKNVKNGFFTSDAEDCRYCALLYLNIKDSYDYTSWGDGVSLIYDSFGIGQQSANIQFSYNSWGNNLDLRYSPYCMNSNNLFGCNGLRKKQHCILNKQYTEEEYRSLLLKIIKRMDEVPYKDSRGRAYSFGEMFPPEMSMYAYNETFAQEFFPYDEAQAKKFGAMWRKPDTKQFTVSIPAKDLPDNITEAPDLLSKEIIGCAHEGKCQDQCTTAFKILPQELAFYKKLGMALPRLCPNCRLQERRAQVGPMKLWDRTCSCTGMRTGEYKNAMEHFHGSNPCPNEFETSYAPERKEIVYCEQCYQAEVA